MQGALSLSHLKVIKGLAIPLPLIQLLSLSRHTAQLHKFNIARARARMVRTGTMQYLPSKEAYSSVSLGCGKSTRASEPLHPIPKHLHACR